MDTIHIRKLVAEIVGGPAEPPPPPPPSEPAEYLRHWIANDQEPNASGLLGLSDFANTLGAAWERRHEPNVHLFHYNALWNDLGEQLTRLADILGVALDADRDSAIVEAATLDKMRSRAKDAAPYGDTTVFKDAEIFFGSGGRREWPDLLTPAEISDVAVRLEGMVGREAAEWALGGGGDELV